MEFKKNQEITLKIDDLGNNGEGIGHVDGYALFVKDALPGENIRAKIMKCKKNYGFARLIEILPDVASLSNAPEEKEAGNGTEKLEISGSAGRIEPKCPVARQCGGCTLQHLSYEKQLAFKEKKVRDCLERIGGVTLDAVEWFSILGAEEGFPDGPWHYRNKAQFPVRMQRGEDGRFYPVAGFYAGRTHSIIPMTDCAIQHPCMKGILEAVLCWMKEKHVPAYDEERHSGLVRHIYIRHGYHTGEIMVCLVINARKMSRELSESLVETLSDIPDVASICLNVNTENTNVILGKEMIFLWGKDHIEDRIGDIRYRISPQSFYQVNPVQTEKLYRTALEFADLSGNEVVWDLYCGIGTISLFLARKAKKVYGVEIVPEAVENAKENARLNGIMNAEFFCGAAEEVVPGLASVFDGTRAGKETMGEMSAEHGDAADVVVVDPPRKGCDAALLDTIGKLSPEKIVYVSCDPATLARDVKVLREKGYEVRKVRVVDQFFWSGHVETVVQLSLKKDASQIEVTMEPGEESYYTPEEKATYPKIREYVKEKYGVDVRFGNGTEL